MTSDNPYGWLLPFNASAHGAGIDQLIYVLHIFMIVLFVGWFSFFMYCLFRFRQKDGVSADSKPKHFKLPTYLEIGVAVFEVALLCAFSIPMFYFSRVNLPAEKDALNIRIVAEQFAWNIHYPGPDGVFGATSVDLMSSSNPLGLDQEDPAAKDDITTINQLHIPVNKPVRARLSSKDVIHSFFLPVLRVKQDAIPGQEIPIWFEAKSTGEFEIACAQLCGLGHYRMRGFFHIDTPEEFQAWHDKMVKV